MSDLDEDFGTPAPRRTGGMIPIGQAHRLLADPKGFAFERQIADACEAARRHGTTLSAPAASAWREGDMDGNLRSELARWGTVASEDAWIAECAALQADTKKRVIDLVAGTSKVLPKRYLDARPLPPEGHPEREDVRALLRARVKSVDAYKATQRAAANIAEGTVSRVLLVGPSGSGKSTLAAILLRMVIAWFEERWEQACPPLPTKPRPMTAADFLFRPSAPEADVTPSPLPPRGAGFPAWDKVGAWRKIARRRNGENPMQWATSRDVFRVASNPPRPKFGEDPEDPLAGWKRAPVLVIDDIGGEPEQRNIEAIDGILWHRHDEHDDLVTVVTSGFYDASAIPKDIAMADEDAIMALLSPLANRYGSALVRRIAEPGQAIIIPVIPKPPQGPPR